MEINLNNLGTVNKNEVVFKNDKGTLTLSYSYKTLIGIELNGTEVYKKAVIENLWNRTTGKFLNELQADKTKRLNQTDFNKEVETILNLYFEKEHKSRL